MNGEKDYRESERYKNAPVWEVDPYKSAPSLNVDLSKLFEYAKNTGKEVYEVTDSEIAMLRNK